MYSDQLASLCHNRFGGWLVTNEVINPATGRAYTGGDVIMVFLSVVMANFHLGQVSRPPPLPALLNSEHTLV